MTKSDSITPDSSTSQGSPEPDPTSPTTAMIGESVKIQGDLSGKEDLIINGNVEGTVDFRESNVSVGEKGKVNANITARNITVAGELKGELRGSEQVSIKPSGRVTGDIRAPRVVLNDGCQFKGLVDMEDKPSVPAEPRHNANRPVGKTSPDRPGGAPGSGGSAPAMPSPTLTRRKI